MGRRLFECICGAECVESVAKKLNTGPNSLNWRRDATYSSSILLESTLSVYVTNVHVFVSIFGGSRLLFVCECCSDAYLSSSTTKTTTTTYSSIFRRVHVRSARRTSHHNSVCLIKWRFCRSVNAIEFQRNTCTYVVCISTYACMYHTLVGYTMCSFEM